MNIDQYDDAYIHQALITALDALVAKDRQLLLDNTNERTITCALSRHLAKQFEGWNVDCEYNRNQGAEKKVMVLRSRLTLAEQKEVSVYPDIIVHHRGTPLNLFVIELKKSTSTVKDHFDHEKLCAYKGQLNYRFAAFVRVTVGKQPGYDKPQYE